MGGSSLSWRHGIAHFMGNRQGDKKAASISGGALHPDASSMSIDNLLHQRKTQADPPEGSGIRIIHAEETFEYLFTIPGGYPDPLVPHGDDDGRGVFTGGYTHITTFRRILDGIGDEIVEYSV